MLQKFYRQEIVSFIFFYLEVTVLEDEGDGHFK